ncbi:MAG: ketoglutarate semialdehyde dehydrogenase [Anaerolineaceae bacterium]|nr:ketoglutarate semialdehyde dehydrogenase [Anaerolineaceae bacterium]
MALQPVLIAGAWRHSKNPVGSFSAVNPTTKTPLPEQYPVSGLEDIELALQAGQGAVAELRSADSPAALVQFLDGFAKQIEARTDVLVETAVLETALPAEPRLRSVELPRTTNQLRQAAVAVRDGSWRRATIDTGSNIRSMYGPLGGPVVVLGPNNFPFAFNSVAGGDFAAAIAAGNPVIAKANPGHPGTTRILAEAAFAAVQASGLPLGMVQLIYHTPPEVGLNLVSEARIGATAFTGSKTAGLALKAAADKAGKPIYLEMSSVNPVFILPGAIRERGAAIAGELYASCSLGAGQFCTKPGIVILQQDENSEEFVTAVQSHFEQNAPGTLLNQAGPTGIAEAIATLQEHGAEIVTGGYEVAEPRFAFANTLLQVLGGRFLAHPHELQTEAFGPVSLLVIAKDITQMAEVAAQLEGNLTGTIYSHSQDADDTAYAQIEPVLRGKVGRLLNDKMPTGVAVVPAMNHGGPFPATGHPGFTAVGIPASLLRFAALHGYDNVRHHRLPPELQDKNPNGRMWRFIDGSWTQEDAGK